MTRLFNFERKEQITDITGNLYDRSTILSIIHRLSCFGVIIEQLKEKRNIDYKSNLSKITANPKDPEKPEIYFSLSLNSGIYSPKYSSLFEII